MKRTFTILFLFSLCFTIEAQTYTWTNADNDFDFENPNNWSPTPIFDNYPTFGEDVRFDGSVSNDGVVIPVDWNINNISFLNGYSGIVDCSGVDFTCVSFNMQSGTFIAPMNDFNYSGNFIKTPSATFTHNNGNVILTITSTGVRNINANALFNKFEIKSSLTGNRTVLFGGANGTPTCQTLTFNGGSNPASYRGLVRVTDNLNISGTAVTAAPNNTGTVEFIGGNNKTVTGASSASCNPIHNITVNCTSGISMSGHITVSGTWNNSNIGSFTTGNSTVTIINGTITSGTTSTTRAYFDNLVSGGSSGLTINGTSQIELRRSLVNNSNINSNNSLIRFNGSSTQSITGTSSTTLNAIHINNSTSISGINVTILDSVKMSSGTFNTGGLLRLRSTSSKKARIAEITAGSISGNVTVETFAPGGVTDWTVLGASGVSGLSFNDWYGQIPMAIEGSTTGVTSVNGQYFESVQGWNETDSYGYDTTISVSSAITPGRGYWVFLGTNLSTTSDMTWSVTGPLVTGNVTIPLTKSPGGQNGWNLIANPYASPISWTKLRAGNTNVADAIYIYNPDLGITTSYVNGVSTPASASANDVIPMGQGFYVEALANTNLTAMESNKVHHNTGSNPLLKTSEQIELNSNSNNNIGQVIRLSIEGGGWYDDAAIRFHSFASANFDLNYDARKMYSSPGYVYYPGIWSKRTVIATQSNNEDYSINSLPFPGNQNVVIPVIARVYSSGMHTITASQIENLPVGSCLQLKDKYLNITHNLMSGPYVCSMSDTTFYPRFELTICANTITNIDEKDKSSDLSQINISKDINGIYADFKLHQPTKSKISVYNVLGQKISEEKSIVVSNERVYIDIHTSDALVFVTVETPNEKVTKKFVINK